MNHRHQPSTTAAADGLQLGSGLRRIACLAALLFIFVSGVRAQYPITGTAFPDKNFYNVVLKNYSMYNGSVFVTNPGVTYMDVKSCNISDLTGIVYFPTLNTLVCSSNKLSSLILTGNTLLQTLDCSNNNLSSVNLSQNALLTTVTIYKNKLRGTYMDNFISNLLDRSGQPTKGELRIIYNENSSTGNKMTSAQVEAAKKKGWTPKMSTNGTTWTDYPGSDAIAINATNFPDENFRSYVSTNFDKNGDGWLLPSEIAAVTKIDVSNEGISSLKGIEYFTALTYLDCSYNGLTELDVSKNTALTKLNCEDSQLASLNVSGCTALTDLKCGWNQLTSLDVSKNTALIELYCYGNQLTTLDVSGCTALTTLDCYINELTFLNVSGCTALTELYCSNNQLTTLDVSGCTALTLLSCVNNQLTSLDVTSCTALRLLYCYKNQIRGQGMTDLINSLPDRRSASEEGELMVYKDETPAGILMTPKQVEVATSKNWSVLRYDVDIRDWVAYEGEPADGIEISEENFPDENFREYVGSAEIDKDEDGYLSDEEIEAVTRIYVESKSIASLKGIEYFTALEELYCHGNQLTTLDVSKNTALTVLDCQYNNLTTLEVSGCTALTALACDGNQMASLDVSGCTALTELYCTDNHLTTLDVSKNTELIKLQCYKNLIRGKGMTDLVSSLPDRNSDTTGYLWAHKEETPAGNLMTPGQVEAATSKKWKVSKYDAAINNTVDYEGETVPGDANGDGEVNATDIDCLRDYILGLDPQPFSFESANLNGDSVVDIQDLTQLIEILLKR